ncbi:MAG: hypothetical protein WCO66_04435 [Candidatus Absconditabacteria bacterium]
MTKKTNQPSNDDKLIFYDIMGYPVPQQREYFVCSEEKTQGIEIDKEVNQISRKEKNPLVEEYLRYIEKRQRLFSLLPFVKTVYLCNSITFNSIHTDSDIDVFIVCKDKTLRRSRFWSVMIFRITGLKRSIRNKKKKFCLSFYVTENHQNLYNISLPKTDIYLAYWIAHLVPIYEETAGNADIYKHNTRIQSLLPNISTQQNIFLNIPCISGNSKFKKILEFMQKGRWGKFIEYCIETIWLPIIIYKIKKLDHQGQDIIVNNFMLKFYADKRKKISLLYKIRRDKVLSQKSKDNI